VRGGGFFDSQPFEALWERNKEEGVVVVGLTLSMYLSIFIGFRDHLIPRVNPMISVKPMNIDRYIYR